MADDIFSYENEIDLSKDKKNDNKERFSETKLLKFTKKDMELLRYSFKRNIEHDNFSSYIRYLIFKSLENEV